MSTKRNVNVSTPDEQLMCDIDLAILGASTTRYKEYAQRVRREYALILDLKKGLFKIWESVQMSGKASATIVGVFIACVFMQASQGTPTDMSLPQRSVWVEASYIECTRTALPCDCPRDPHVILAEIDLSRMEVNLIDIVESTTMSLRMLPNGYLESVDTRGNYDSTLSIRRSGDTITCEFGTHTTVLVKQDYVPLSVKTNDLLGYVTYHLTWKYLSRMGCDSIDLLRSRTITSLRCNADLGLKNVVTLEGAEGCPLIVESLDDYLVFFQLDEPCDRKMAPGSYHWREVARVRKGEK